MRKLEACPHPQALKLLEQESPENWNVPRNQWPKTSNDLLLSQALAVLHCVLETGGHV